MSENKSTKKKKKSGAPVLLLVISCIIGAVGGFWAARAGFSRSSGFGGVLYILLVGFAAMYLGIIIHEAGHLVMGLLTGYEFVSFRVGSLTLVKENGKLVRRRFNVVGTGGQCVLKPKETDDPAALPYFWYNFGGVFFNLLSAAFALPFAVFISNKYVSEGFFIFAAISVFFAIVNGIPIKSTVSNDGKNIVDMHRDPALRTMLYKIMLVNGLQYEGTELCDMPKEIKEYTEAEKKCSLGISALIMEGNLLMNEFRFEESLNCYRAAAEDENAAKVYVNECMCEQMFNMIMTGASKEEIDEVYDKELQQYVKLTGKCYVMRKRLLYAYYTLIEKDAEKAAKEYDAAVKMKSTYPSKGEYSAEMKIINYVKEHSHEKGIS